MTEQRRDQPTPIYQITINGNDITPTIDPRLISLTLTDNRGEEADELEIVLADADGLLEIPPKNATLSLSLGWKNTGLVHKGDFAVNECNWSGPPDTLTITAKSVDFLGPLKTKRTQSWHQVALQTILDTIAKRQDLTPEIEKALGAINVDHIDQTNESDLNFISRLGKLYGATATVKAQRLLFMPQGKGNTVSGIALPTVSITRRDCTRYTYREENRDAEFTGVQAHWNDKKGAKLHTETVGNADNPKALRYTYRSATEARRAAEAEWDRISRSAAAMSLDIATADLSLMADSPVSLSGFKGKVDGIEWLATKITTTLSSGMTQSVELENSAASQDEVESGEEE